jgi:putative tryptophan/tyrosine transport system substrate-binding protein
MKRREFIAGLGSAAAWPLAARGQQTTPVIGFLNIGSPETFGVYVAAFKRGLTDAGYAEGRNVGIEYRWARGQYDRLAELAADLVNRRVAVIAANGGGIAAFAAKAATSTIPIVFTFGDGDPVRYGLVASLNRPGGNITGVTMIAGVLEPKRLEFLREVMPAAEQIYMLINPNNASAGMDSAEVAVATHKLGLELKIVKASTETEIDAAFATLAEARARALMVINDAFLMVRREQITALATSHRIATVYPWREYAAVGGLMSYGASIEDSYRQSGAYVGRILGGAKADDLPVVQPTKFELVINLNNAKALGLDIPPTLLALADEVIE